MTVHAPFRFAPINRWVWFPKWGHLVSHDVPFKDGISGEIDLEIKAKTPLLLGGPRRKPSEGQEGEVWPFETVDPQDGRLRYAIPGSALQGMIRSILEVAAFGRLGPFVDSRRFGFRDVGGSATGTEHYRNRMTTGVDQIVTQHAKPGWLIKGGDGAHKIVPCSFARIHVEEVRRLKGAPAPAPQNVMGQRNGAGERYNWFLGGGNPTNFSGLNRAVYLDPPTDHTHANGAIRINYQRAFAATTPARTRVDGTLIFTGKPQNGLGPGQKKFEFVFHTPNRNHAPENLRDGLTVAPDVWKDFAHIHNHDRLPGRRPNPNWEFWRSEYEAGKPVPVFYLSREGGISTFGTAFMFKAALPLSTHDMLRNSSEDHLIENANDGTREERLDLPSLIFGFAADTSDNSGPRGLKRRATFGTAITTVPLSRDQLHLLDRAILLEPKPSYFPSYVRQPGNPNTGRLDDIGRSFALYASSSTRQEAERRRPELAGVKLWPARNRLVEQGFPQHPANQNNIQSTLRAVPGGAAFVTTLRIHNLRPAELGALLWALTFGEESAWTQNGQPGLRHRLGLAKPYGFGEMHVRVMGTKLRDPQGRPLNANCQQWIGDFSSAINQAAAASGVRTTTGTPFVWAESIQVKTLLAAADPALGGQADQPVQDHPGRRHLDYMELTTGHDGHNQFQQAKGAGHFLPLYAQGAEVRRDGMQHANGAPPEDPNLPRPGTRMRDIENDAWVLVQGAGATQGFVRVIYEEGEDEDERPLHLLARH